MEIQTLPTEENPAEPSQIHPLLHPELHVDFKSSNMDIVVQYKTLLSYFSYYKAHFKSFFFLKN